MLKQSLALIQDTVSKHAEESILSERDIKKVLSKSGMIAYRVY